MNGHLNVDLCKILKNKGFKERCDGFWYYSNLPDSNYWSVTYPQTKFERWYKDEILAPTIQQTVTWLYKKFGIWVTVKQIDQKETFTWEIVQSNKEKWNSINWSGDEIEDPEKAYHMAIEWCLKELL